jgi:Ca-activated chloride channel homolog
MTLAPAKSIRHLVLIAPAAAALIGAAGVQRPVFRSGIQTVSLYVTVRSTDGRLVPDLTRDEFQIYDNGKLQPIAVFRNDVVPITVAVMLDVSNSVVDETAGVKAAARVFVSELGPLDRARIGSFGEEIAISPRLTGDRTYLERVLDEEIWRGGATPLWPAIDAAMTSLENEPGRRVVLVYTDGFHNPVGFAGGRSTRSDIERRVDREGFMIYVVGLPAGAMGSRAATRMNPEMKSLSVDSGGGYYEVRTDDDSAAAMKRIAEELHHQYVIGFAVPASDGKAHRLDVKVTRPGTTARTRKVYVASSS